MKTNQLAEFEVDLRWSLWTITETEFPDRCLWRMVRAFNGEMSPVVIRTAPGKEIRFGSVEIYSGGADVCFYLEWDDPCELARMTSERLGLEDLSEAERDYLCDSIATWCSEATWSITRSVSAQTFEELMERIDEVESDLIELEQQQEGAFTEYLDSLGASIKAERGTEQ